MRRAIRRRSSPVAARRGEVGGESAVVAGAPKISLSVVVYAISLLTETEEPPATWRRRRGGIPLARRVPASKGTSERIRQRLEDSPEEGGMREELQLAVRTLIEEAVETGVTEALGRGYYERSEEPARG